MVVALTGGTGSGKGYIARILEDLGAYIIDADAIGHGIIKKGKPAYNEIVKYFVTEQGANILDEQEEIIRKELGKIVFADKEKLEILNSCTHKYIELEILESVTNNENEKRVIFIDIPLLKEGIVLDRCDKVWSVFAPADQRIERILNRDNISLEVANNRVNSQKDWTYYKEISDFVIDNSNDNGINDLKKVITENFQKLEKDM